MERVAEKIWTFLVGKDKIQQTTNAAVRRDSGYAVENYEQLVRLVSEISFRNPEYVLLFRGQSRDHQCSKKYSSLHSQIFRQSPGEKRTKAKVLERFNELRKAEKLLVQHYTFEGRTRVKRDQILRWSIIQHYEIYPTPLLDVSQSLRVAASFSHLNSSGRSYLYVLGLPQISGSITTSSEAQCQIVRLLSVCPPSAARPHYQEGYLVGEYPTPNFINELPYIPSELDFGRRLIAKFELSKKASFWSEPFPRIGREALYPDHADDFKSIADEIKSQLSRNAL
jgi:hypothetical protein